MNVEVVVPYRATDALSEVLVRLTRTLHETGKADGARGGLLGGEFGYGADFESDVFMLHRYCWCDQDDCPWCGGCLEDHGEPNHDPLCYQWRVYRDLVAEGFEPALWSDGGPYAAPPQGWTWDQRREVEDRVRRKWCRRMGLSFPASCAVHCTCGASNEWLARVESCLCDACTASGIYAEAGALPGRGAPNFWHKPSGVRVWWYKYIGRDMKVHVPEGEGVVRAVEAAISSLGSEN